VKARLFGLICLAVAVAAGWWGIWEPLQQAAAQQPHVRYSTKVFVLVPAAAVFGLFFLLFGNRFPYRNEAHSNFTLVGWLLMAGVLAGSAGGFWWFKQKFEGYGYAWSGADPQPVHSFIPPLIPKPPVVRPPD